MSAKVTFFRVDNGDMTLTTLESGRTILTDCNIRKKADDPDDDTPDVASQLRERLKKDSKGRYFVDVMVLSHPDEDHCRGLATHFHLGSIADYPDDSDLIIIREMWSSPIVFRRAHHKHHKLCADAKAWNAEAKRRVRYFEENGSFPANERILILGEDEDGKTDDLGDIVITTESTITKINGTTEPLFRALLIAPLSATDDEEEELLSKNDSSTIIRYQIGAGTEADACRFLTGGDAEVAIWERIWDRHETNPDALSYDLMQTPHHCSWHSLSYDSWSEYGEDAELSEKAFNALSQARDGAKIVASSKTIADDDSDPPCIRAKREYEAIAKDVSGEFVCVGDDGPEPLEFEIVSGGLKILTKAVAVAAPYIRVGQERQGHG